MGFVEIENFLWAGMIFCAFYITCCGLLERRFSRRKTALLGGVLSAGIVLLQAGLLVSGRDPTLVLTLLPLTAYLPVMLGVHILSRFGFFQTAAVWTSGLLVSGILSLLQKLLLRYVVAISELVFWQRSLIITGCLLLAAVLLLLVVLRCLRKPFRAYVLHNKTNWLPLCFPVVMVFLLFSYFSNSVTNMTVLVLIFFTALSVFLILARVLVYAAREQRMRKTEQAVTAQLEIQRQEYETICKKIETGRAYRHDMRHHLSVLEELAAEGSNQEILGYIGGINGQLREAEQTAYCENTAVNAVLCAYIRRAEQAGCSVTARMDIPCEIPFDPLDICSVLANALENATNACLENTRQEDRCFSLSAVFEDDQKLILTIENPCEQPVRIGKSGFPDVPFRDGHGIGLKSVGRIADKYNGLFRCAYTEGVFTLNVILFGSRTLVSPREKTNKPKKAAAVTLTVFLAFCLTVNCLPAAAQAWEDIPLLGPLIRVVNLKTYDFSWGDTSYHVMLPQIELAGSPGGDAPPAEMAENTASAPEPTKRTESDGQCSSDVSSVTEDRSDPPVSQTAPDSSGTSSREDGTQPTTPAVTVLENPSQPEKTPDASEITPCNPTSTQPDGSAGVDAINRQMEDFVKRLREKFLWYVARKYEGYVSLDAQYTVLRNDDQLLVIRFDATINAGGSGQYSRSFVLDKKTGESLELSDLFPDGSGYIRTISEEVKRQMAQRENFSDYFIPGGIWSGDELFKEIASDQNFYINGQNQLVIVFDEYEVASGNVGMPEFVIPAEVLDGLLPPSSFLRQ